MSSDDLQLIAAADSASTAVSIAGGAAGTAGGAGEPIAFFNVDNICIYVKMTARIGLIENFMIKHRNQN